MKLYISYVNNYSKSMETLHLCKQSPQFCTLLEVCRVMSTRVKRQCNLAYFQQVGSFFFLPFCTYLLSITRLVKETPVALH